MKNVRIWVKWNNVIPSLKVATGILKAETQNMNGVVDGRSTIIFEELFTCKVKAEPGMIGYEGIDGKGIKGLYLDLYKNNIDVMLRSYHDGITLEEETVFWIDEPEYYTITTIYTKLKKKQLIVTDRRCVGFLTDKMLAIDIIRQNGGDIHEDSYTYAILEKIQPGLYPTVLEEYWFKWDQDKNEYVGCTKPENFTNVTNFGIG